MLNGNLIGSIVMRLKIGKPNLIKDPINKKQLEKNFDEIVRVCLHRNYKSVRKLASTEPSYEEYIGIISEIRK